MGGVRAQVLPVTRPGPLAQVIRIQPGWGRVWGRVGGRVTEAGTSTGQKEIQEESRRLRQNKGWRAKRAAQRGDGMERQRNGERRETDTERHRSCHCPHHIRFPKLPDPSKK